MSDLRVFIRLMGHHTGWLVLGGLLALLALGAGIGLLTLAGGFVAAGAVGATAMIAGSGGWLRGLAVGRILARYGERLATHEATFRALAHIRVWFFAQVIPLAPTRLGGFRGGDLLARVVGDIEALDSLYLRILVPSAVAALLSAALILFVGSASLAIALSLILLLAIAGIGVPALMHRLGAAAARAQIERAAELRVAVVDVIQGVAELKAYQAAERYLNRVEAIDTELVAARRRSAWLAGFSTGLTGLVASLAVLVVLAIGSGEVAAGALDRIELAMLTLCAMAAFEMVAPLPLAYQLLGKAMAAAGRLLEVARAEPAISEPADMSNPPEPTGDDIRFTGVSLSYPGAGRPALAGIDLTVPQGARIALVGASGSGKSSLIQLLLRFLEVDAGKIEIGGVDVRVLPSNQVRARIGVLSQRAQIFAASLRDNLLIGDPEADDAALTRALTQAGLGEFLAALPEGLDTWLGESGTAVSGGQARRIALARVYLKDAPILLLDEPTEGLDETTERDVLGRLAEIAEGRTVLMVTHRPAGLDLVERVVRLDRGRIIADV